MGQENHKIKLNNVGRALHFLPEYCLDGNGTYRGEGEETKGIKGGKGKPAKGTELKSGQGWSHHDNQNK